MTYLMVFGSRYQMGIAPNYGYTLQKTGFADYDLITQLKRIIALIIIRTKIFFMLNFRKKCDAKYEDLLRVKCAVNVAKVS